MNELLIVALVGGAISMTLLLIEVRLEDYSLGLERPERQEKLENPFEDYSDGVEAGEEKEWKYNTDEL